MKKVFTIATFAGLIACNNEPEVHIMGTQHDFTQDTKPTQELTFVPDSAFVARFKAYNDSLNSINSLTTVNELLDHLETLPAE